MHELSTLRHLKWLCRGVIIVTALFSVWANVLHVTNVTIPAIIFAAAPPLVVLGGFEMVSRIPMRENAKWYNRWSRPVATAAISGGGAWLSYWHQKGAIFRYNSGDEQNATILPLLIDGLMIVASVSVIELNHQIRAITARNAGIELAKAKLAEPPKEKPLSQKERIAVALAEMPWATAKEIAAKAQTKEPYTATVVSDLRRAQRAANGNGHHTEAVRVN